MASLLQTIRTGSGQLEKVSGLDSAMDADLQAPPVTPMGMSGLPGTNPDISKMAGVPAQKTNALRMAIQGQEDLGTRQRQTQVRTGATAEEQKQLSLAEQLSKTGGLGARVPTMVANLVNQAQQAGTQAPVTGNLTADAGLNTAIGSILNNPTDYASAKLIADKMGLPAPTDLPSMTAFRTALEGKIPGFAQAASAQALQGSKQALKLTPTDWQSLGFTDENQVAQLLQIPVEELQGMTIDQVVDSIQTEIYRDFNEVAQWEQRANDPTLGATERAEARANLRDLGAVGIRSAESTMDVLADDLIQAKQVEINGQYIPVSDLLNSEYVSGLAKSYLEGAAGFQEEFRKNEPDLAKFFDTYRDVIKDVVADIDVGMQNFANLQMQNAGLAKTSTGSQLPNDIMQTIFPDWSQTSTAPYDVSSLPNGGAVFRALQGQTGLNDTEINDLYNHIVSLGRGNPGLAAQLLTEFTEADLRKYGLLQRGSDAVRQFERNLEDVKRLGQLGPNSTPDEMARMTGARSAADLDNLIEEINQMSRSGLFAPVGFDTQNVRGESLRMQIEQMQRNIPQTLKGIGEFRNSAADLYGKMRDYVDQQKSPAYQALQPYLSVGVTIPEQAAEQIAGNVDLGTMENIITKTNFSRLFTPDAQRVMIDEFRDRFTGENVQPLAELSGFETVAGAEPGIQLRNSRINDFNRALNDLKSKLAGEAKGGMSTQSLIAVKYGDAADKLTAVARDNLRDLTDLYNNSKAYVTSLETFRDGNMSAQVGPMAARYSNLLDSAKASVGKIEKMMDFYRPFTSTGILAQDYRNWLNATPAPQAPSSPTSLIQTLQSADAPVSNITSPGQLILNGGVS